MAARHVSYLGQAGGDRTDPPPMRSEGKTFLYFLAIMAFDWLQFTAFRLARSSEPIPAWNQFDAWFAFAITIAALVYLFLCNGGPRGAQFLYRYFPLSVVVGWKSVAASLVALPTLKMLLGGASPNVSGWSVAATLATLNVLMFYRIGHHLQGLGREARAQPALAADAPQAARR